MSPRIASRVRQLLVQTEEARQRYVEAVLAAGPLVTGSLVTLGRKCGKPNCRCATGEKHISKFLSRSEAGRTRLVYVPASDAMGLATKTASYRSVREARAALMKLAVQAAELIDELVSALSEPYAPADRPAARKARRQGTRGRSSAD
jgi:hypothetical protein